ncbi:MAG: asnB [Burkholderiales bacterium]|jgi:asparagine synthase (glutamine-hydrolysing)|nr:asnB [Burkholderiales bacterium]
MCGIVGFIDETINYDALDTVDKMGQVQESRGPDSFGVWSDGTLGVYFKHQRLSILDLSPAGHQPMLSVSARYVISFNGEVYNWKKIKFNLEQICGQINWKGHSDTEIILMAFEVYGIDIALELIEGMFAIALWDRQEEILYLIRDRIGEKPLCYGYFNGVFAFSSVLTSLKMHPKFEHKINREAIGQMLLHSCVPPPLSIFEGIYKLMPGTYLKLSYANYKNKVLPEPVRYWCLTDFLDNKYNGSIIDAQNELHMLLRKSVSDQIFADVSVGCFLSGGIDSSTVAAIMQEQSPIPVNTFSIGFHDPAYNEAHFAKSIAKHLGTRHTELYVTSKDVLNVIPQLFSIYDEPFSDPSQIPTYLVAKLAKQHVTVALSGDGGDELFAGYNRYLYSEKLYNKVSHIPYWLRKLIIHIPVEYLLPLNRFLKLPVKSLNDKLVKLYGLLEAKDFFSFYLNLTGNWLNYNEVVLGINGNSSLWERRILEFEKNPVLGMQYLDSLGYLPDDILVKVDRATMANSLESRMPLLNHNIIKFAFSLPMSYKVHQGCSKWLMRQILYQYVPKELVIRPKTGFDIPISNWIRHDLKDWAIALLDASKIKNQGYLNAELIQKKLDQHLSGTANNASCLWDVLMFQQWLESS